MQSMDTIRFKNDADMRRHLFVPESMAHPAKGNIFLWQEMIEKYSNPGETVLDVMAFRKPDTVSRPAGPWAGGVRGRNQRIVG